MDDVHCAAYFYHFTLCSHQHKIHHMHTVSWITSIISISHCLKVAHKYSYTFLGWKRLFTASSFMPSCNLIRVSMNFFIVMLFWRTVLSIFFLNSKMYRTMLQNSFSEHLDPPTSLLCFILFIGYLLSRGLNTSCLCFA